MVKINKNVEIMEIVDENGEIRKGAFIENYEGGFYQPESVEKMKQYQIEKRNYEVFADIVGGFSFMLVDTLKELHKDTRFTDIEKARIMFLGTFCSYESSGRYLFTNNNRHILKSDLQELLEVTNKQEFYKLYNKLVETEIIEEEVISRSEIRLKWNDKYHFKGATSSKGVKSVDTVKAYDRQIQTLYKEKNAKGKNINTPKNLYVLFMILPFINSESGVLCNQQHNPIEEACEPLELNDIAEMLLCKIIHAKNKTIKL